MEHLCRPTAEAEHAAFPNHDRSPPIIGEAANGQAMRWGMAVLLVMGLCAEVAKAEDATPSEQAALSEDQRLAASVIGQYIKSRNALRSGVFRVDGELRESTGELELPAGRIAIFCGFDVDRKLLRFDRTDPMKQGRRFVPGRRKLVRTEKFQIRYHERISGSKSIGRAYREPSRGKPLATHRVFDARLVGAANWGTLDHDFAWDKYCDLLQQQKGDFRLRTVKEDGSHFQAVFIDDNGPIRTSIRFDPAQGFTPVRYELSRHDPKDPDNWRGPIERGQTTWQQIEGVWLPQVCRQESIGTATGKKSIRTLRFHWLSINQPVEAPLFTLEDLALPEGTLLTDRTQARTMLYRISNGQLLPPTNRKSSRRRRR